MTGRTDLLIVGAGPFGLAMAAYARAMKIDHVIVGKPMDFWKAHMPGGLILRSACDWHLDPFEIHTIVNYLQTRSLTPADVEPLSLELYLDYVEWFQQQKRIEVRPSLVERLDHDDKGNRFRAALDDGTDLTANKVLLALGFRYFPNVPEHLAEILPAGRFAHTCDAVDMESFRGQRCLIIGGRQSAFEWAALLREHGAAEVHVSHRQETPAFRASDWSWVGPMVEGMVENPGWFRDLPTGEKDELVKRFWAEGRLKLEPWLRPRIAHDNVHLWPKSRVVGCEGLPSGDLEVALDTGQKLVVDRIILATGYRVNLAKVPFLAKGNILAALKMKDGYPVLDDRLQSSIPGLFFTSMPATRDFGPFFAFTVSVVAATKIIGSFLLDAGRESG